MSSATKTVRKSRFQNYTDLLSHVEKPLAKRRELAIGRGGSLVKPRKFHLSDAEVTDLRASFKETKRFPNPHNRGFYFYLIEALVDLGINEAHSQSKVLGRVEKLMSSEDTIEGEGKEATTAWDRFINKDPRNAETGKDYEARFDQNVTVLQRLSGLTPYGLKLLEVGTKVLGTAGAVIDVLVGERGGKSLRLNTRSDRPINEGKVRGFGSPAAIAAERAEKRAIKQSAKQTADQPAPKAKRVRKPKVEATAPAAEADATPATAEATA